jgi:hypothetical protein
MSSTTSAPHLQAFESIFNHAKIAQIQAMLMHHLNIHPNCAYTRDVLPGKAGRVWIAVVVEVMKQPAVVFILYRMVVPSEPYLTELSLIFRTKFSLCTICFSIVDPPIFVRNLGHTSFHMCSFLHIFITPYPFFADNWG